MSAIFLLPVCLTYWPRKYTTRANPHVDNSHQVWSWYVYPLPNYSVLSADTSRDLVTLTFDLLTFNSCHTWRVTWSTLPPSLKTLRLFAHELRVPWVGAQKQLRFWNPRLWFAYSLCNFCGSTMNIIKVICENNALPCVKRRMRFCARAKSRDLLKVSYVSYCSRSRRRRFTLLDFKCWAYSRIYGHFQQHLYCACAETVIYELPV